MKRVRPLLVILLAVFPFPGTASAAAETVGGTTEGRTATSWLRAVCGEGAVQTPDARPKLLPASRNRLLDTNTEE